MTEHQGASTGSGATINAVDIARLAGVGRAAVSNWRKRYEDFPEPVAGTASSPLFDAEQARAWLREQGKLKELPLRDELWRALEELRSTTDPGEALITFAVGLRHFAARETKPADELDAEVLADDVSFVESVAERIAATGAEQEWLEPAVPEGRWAPLLRLLDRVLDEPEEFDALVLSWADRLGRHGGAVPSELAELMYRLAEGTRVLDPHCGLGELLRPAAEATPTGKDEPAVAGQHPDRQVARIAAASLWFRCGIVPRIEVGDALRADAFTGETFDSVLCAPPWGVKDWGFEELQFDPRWEYGLPPRRLPELAWVQHALAHLDRSGTAVLLLPAGVGFQTRGRRIRAELIRRGALRAVIALPAGAFTMLSASTPIVLWVLRSPESTTEHSDGVLLVDGSELRSGRTPDWQALSDLALSAWREFESTGECPERPGKCGVVPAIDLLDDEVNLTPARHLPVTPEIDVAGIRTSRGRFLDVLGQLPQLVPEVAPRSDPPAPSTTINELSRIGALTVRQQPGPAAKEETEGALPALTGRDVTRGSAPSGFWDDSGPREPIWLQPGDVVVPMLGGNLTSRVIGEERAVLGTHLWLLRPNPEQLDPWFLAGFLRNSANTVLTTGSMAARLDVRKVELPRIPLSEQHPYANAFKQLFLLERGLRQVQQHGGDLITTMIDGMASNALRPPEGPGNSDNTTGTVDDTHE
ncbi:N-6 DNA methylase [Haloactinomyces albus]|uniref:SAM-dependent methyltransferase n=1 Tax=Haloactinomyces albus TaxID=1352928 RepID=A0AAE3ZHW7_9ACTN|nr:N-6 DNA methylase [Haloactinomyces albus]MDR7304216.1 SAM-dependent methyltransferase [Haloactinomyces albus]